LREVYGTFVGRWYVTALGIVFAWRAARQLGWRRTAIYAAAAIGLGALAENASVHVGIPYTRYVFNPALRGKELFVGDVPLMVPLSYTFLGYFGYAAGRILASGPYATRARRPWQEYVLGVLLTVWAIWIMDPVSRLGQHWFLGQVFGYRGPGFWFGLPLASQIGFTLTAALLVGLLSWLTRREPDRPVARLRDHPHLVSLTTYASQLAWLSIVALVVGADTLGGSTLIVWLPVVAITAVTWSNQRSSSREAQVQQAGGSAS
jgi:uncharacterized membrane protein